MLTDEQIKQFGRLETRIHQLLNHHASLEELELFQEYTATFSTLQQQNKQAVTAFETIHGIASETFESPNQLELIRLTASDTLLSLQDKPL